MFYVINKLVGAALNPLSIGIGLMAVSVLLAALPNGVRRWNLKWWGMGIGVFAVLWFWVWGTQAMMKMFALPLETEFPVVKAEDAPVCDAIVVLGGGMGANSNNYPYAEMWSGADRIWHAARLFKAGKAPVVIPTGMGEEASTVPLLLDLGVPREAIRVEPDARNTEENAKFVERMLRKRVEGSKFKIESCRLNVEGQSGKPTNQLTRPKVLLVTSAWHMRRSLLMYRKYAPELEVVPAATDYETLVNSTPFQFADLLPSPDRFQRNCIAFKEYIGYWGYRLLRR